MPALKTAAPERDRGTSTKTSAVDIRQVKFPAMRLPLSPREKRSGVRVSSKLPVTVKYGGIYEAFGQAINLSARGLFFELDGTLAPGAVVQLVFRLPGEVVGGRAIWLRCQAEVVRVEEGSQHNRFRIAARLISYEAFRVS
jgi:PilZ domain-containing protein